MLFWELEVSHLNLSRLFFFEKFNYRKLGIQRSKAVKINDNKNSRNNLIIKLIELITNGVFIYPKLMHGFFICDQM